MHYLREKPAPIAFNKRKQESHLRGLVLLAFFWSLQGSQLLARAWNSIYLRTIGMSASDPKRT
jgi:hypothetical protein